MTDVLLKEFFNVERWENAINIGVVKGIDKGELRKLTSPETRVRLYNAIVNDNYRIAPPHQALIPKDNGEFRTVYVNENIDRIFLSIVNEMLFDYCEDMIHYTCKSYQHGIGCGKVVQELVKESEYMKSSVIGYKADLSKYFDSVPIEYIDLMFDLVEQKLGKSKIIDIVREYYHTDLCFDPDNNLIEHYQSLKQGCAVASWLADAVLWHIDNRMEKECDCYYVRYSDDIVAIGKDWKKSKEILEEELGKMNMKLNPKKVEILTKDKWFKFLGFNIKGSQITLSKSRLKSFQKEITSRCKSVSKINRFLYRGDGQYSWATSVLPIINVDKDIDLLNEFVMDCIRVGKINKGKVKPTEIGGLGSVQGSDYTIERGKGSRVKTARERTPKEIDGYLSIRCMRNAILTDRDVYECLVRQMQ